MNSKMLNSVYFKVDQTSWCCIMHKYSVTFPVVNWMIQLNFLSDYLTCTIASEIE